MKLTIKTFYILIAIFTFLSCSVNDRNERELSSEDIQFITNLGLLEKDEQIEIFESNGGFKGYKQSGNFITNKRIASYWLEDHQREINFAYFNEIDSITETDLTTKLTYASYLTIYKTDRTNFKVYIDADSSRTYLFFDKAKVNFQKFK